MEPLVKHTGVVAPLDQSHVDTDVILPAAYLSSTARTGFGMHLFAGWRYSGASPTDGASDRRENSDFVLNRAPYRNASILLTRANFGCGSSREHAVWALREFGFRAVIAESFNEIFRLNMLNSSLLPVVLPRESISALFVHVERAPGVTMTLDVGSAELTLKGATDTQFELAASNQRKLLLGLDDIDETLVHKQVIRAFERSYLAASRWTRAPGEEA